MSDIKLTKEEERVIWEWLLTHIGDEEMVHELDQKELIFKCCSSHRSFGVLPSELFQIFNTQMKESIIYHPLGQNDMLKLIESFRIQLSREAVEYLESKYPIIIFRTPTGRISRVDSYTPVSIRNQSGNDSTKTAAITTNSYQPMEDSEKIEIIGYVLEQLKIKRGYANLKITSDKFWSSFLGSRPPSTNMKPRSRWSLVSSWRRLVSNPDEMTSLDVDKDVPLSLIKLIPIKLDTETRESYSDYIALDVTTGRDFFRKDGLMATVAVSKHSFVFCVWHERHQNMDRFNDFTHKEYFNTYTDGDVLQTVNCGFNYLNELFYCPLPYVIIDTKYVLKSKSPFFFGLKECGRLCIELKKEIPNEDLNSILQEIKIRKRLEIHGPINKSFKFDTGKCEQPEQIFMEQAAHCISSEMLFKLNCSHLILNGCNFTINDCHTFVERWMNSDDTFISLVQFGWDNIRSENFDFEALGLKPVKFDPKTRSHVYIYSPKIAFDVSAGKDFVRKDGLMATIAEYTHTFLFCVWHERHHNLDGQEVFRMLF